MIPNNIFELITNWLLGHGTKIILIIVAAFVAHFVIKSLIEKLVKKIIVSKPDEDEKAESKREDTLIGIFHGTAHTFIILVVLLMILSEIGIDTAPLIAGAGVIGIAVGFGGQYLIRDLISGFFIILENQFRVGDAITIAGNSGLVENITLRKTVIRDLDGIVHHVPNGEIDVVSNMTQGVSKVNLNIGVAYDSDIEKVIKITNMVCDELSNDEYFGPKIKEAPKFLRVDNLGDSSVEIKIIGVTTPGSHWEITGELRKRLLQTFTKEGIEIPFPQVMVHNSK